MPDAATGTRNRHAVRWANRTVRRELDWGRWHLTDDGSHTLCGRPIALGVASFLPDTDEELDRADCAACRRKHDREETGT